MEANQEDGVFELGGNFFATLRPRSKEWHSAWRGLADQSGDADQLAEDPQTHECWQYLATIWRHQRWFHEFRHRCHPRTGEYLSLFVTATDGWKPADEKVRRRVLH